MKTAVQVADAVSRLPDAYREVIVLRHLQDLAFADVADAWVVRRRV